MPKVRADRKQIYAVVSRKDLDTLQTTYPEEPTSTLVRKAVELWAETVRKAEHHRAAPATARAKRSTKAGGQRRPL